MQQVILHIGAPKTGSTYLQNWLKANCLELKNQNIFSLNGLESHKIATFCINNPQSNQREDIQYINKISITKVLKNLKEHQNDRAIISSEYFSICEPYILHLLFKQYDIEVCKIICFVRRQDRMAASTYKQAVKASKESEIPIAAYIQEWDWLHLYNLWQKNFPTADLLFQNYDHYCSKGKLLEIFKQNIGITQISNEELPNQSQENKGLNAKMTEIARLANSCNNSSIIPLLLEAQQNKFSGPPFAFSLENTQILEQAFRQTNHNFFQIVGKPEFEELVTPNWQPEGREFFEKLSNTTIMEVLCHIYNQEPV